MNETYEKGVYRSSVYIPPTYRGNALELGMAREECEAHSERPCPAQEQDGCTGGDGKREGGILSRLLSCDSETIWVLLLVGAVLLLGREKNESCDTDHGDALWYLLLLVLVL